MKKKSLNERNERIRKRCDELLKQKKNAWDVYEQVAGEFFLEVLTVRQIHRQYAYYRVKL